MLGYWRDQCDPANTCFPAGQGVGGFHEIKPAGEVLREIVAQAEAVLLRQTETIRSRATAGSSGTAG